MGFRACMDRQIDEHVALTNPDWSIGIFLPIAKTNCPNREWAMTGRIFQALPNFCPHRQIDTMFALIYKIMLSQTLVYKIKVGEVNLTNF
jgi:hypothetical protein